MEGLEEELQILRQLLQGYKEKSERTTMIINRILSQLEQEEYTKQTVIEIAREALEELS